MSQSLPRKRGRPPLQIADGLKVEMHNNLVRHTMESLTHLSVVDQRVVGYLVSVGIKNPQDGGMPRRIVGSVSDLAAICGITGGRIYEQVRKATESLMTQLIRFKHPDTGKSVSTTWLAEGVYAEGEGTFEVQFSDSMQRLLTELSKHRTVMELETMLGLGASQYAIRLYQIGKSYESLKGWGTSIEYLREQLGVPKGSYERISDFKRVVLDGPLTTINGSSDIQLTYVKQNHGRAWTHLAFVVKKRSQEKRLKIRERDVTSLAQAEQDACWRWLRTQLAGQDLPSERDWSKCTTKLRDVLLYWEEEQAQGKLPL